MHIKPSVISDVFNDAMGEIAYIEQIQIVVDFDRPLEKKVLEKAFLALLKNHSVFGYFFVPRFIWPYWERFDDETLAERARIERVLVKQEDMEGETERFLALPMDHHKEPQLRLNLIAHEGGERLILKVNHMAADAAGTKDTMYLLADLYSKMLDDEHFVPRSDSGSRGIYQVLRGSLPQKIPGMMLNYFKDIYDSFRFPDPLTLASGHHRVGDPVFLFHRFAPKTMEVIARLRDRHGVTINDVLLTSMVHGALAFDSRETGQMMRLMGTVDLRRYLSSGTPPNFTNLSSFFFPQVGSYEGESFSETLIRVKEVMDGLKQQDMGLGWIFGSVVMLGAYPFGVKKKIIHSIFNRLAQQNNMGLSLTNLGELDARRLQFGQLTPHNAVVVTPGCIPPSFFMGVSGFSDSLTLSMGFYESAFESDRIRDFFAAMESAVLSG
ncbi:hypothetical protein KKF84_21880 [Myxococcota bacterium]|nr:hypothetical protein [Myxococcota bacterium]